MLVRVKSRVDYVTTPGICQRKNLRGKTVGGLALGRDISQIEFELHLPVYGKTANRGSAGRHCQRAIDPNASVLWRFIATSEPPNNKRRTETQSQAHGHRKNTPEFVHIRPGVCARTAGCKAIFPAGATIPILRTFF